MDLKDMNLGESADEGATLELEHPVTGEVIKQDDNETPVTIVLAGNDSKRYKKAQKEQQEKRLSKMARSRSRKNLKIEVSDEDACRLLAACTIGWSGIVEAGKEIEFSEEAAFDLYMRYGWIREQADEFIGDRANFFTMK